MDRDRMLRMLDDVIIACGQIKRALQPTEETDAVAKFIVNAQNLPPLIAGETIAEYCERVRRSQPPT